MAANNWNWKSKDGRTGGLLYESGNWGDILKMLWVTEIIRWKQKAGINCNYFDPFAGNVRYPLGKKYGFRIEQCWLKELDFIHEAFLANGFWPSAASGALLLATGRAEVWDADPGRRENWQLAGVRLADAEGAAGPDASGWNLLRNHRADPDALWLLDPYDFLAEWRARLELVAEKSRSSSILLYVYNRSAKNNETFGDYRRFRGRLDDLRGDMPLRLGRVAADCFLPRSHHEMVFLPGEEDCRRPGFEQLLDRLGDLAEKLARAQRRLAVFDC